MKTLNISEARNKLSALVASVASTHAPVVLLRYGKPAAMLVPVETEPARVNPYPLRGAPLTVPDDFDAPLEELWGAFAMAGAEEAYGAGEGRRPGAKGAERTGSRP